MSKRTSTSAEYRRKLARRLERREASKLRGRRGKGRSLWQGFGVFGVIGWSVVVPAIAGVALGLWIDGRWPGHVSWTLTLLLAGLVLGCLNAWHWVSRQRREIEEERKRDD